MSISDRMPSVVVEYDSRGKRVVKCFANPCKARSFYAVKLREGKNPKVRAIEPLGDGIRHGWEAND